MINLPSQIWRFYLRPLWRYEKCYKMGWFGLVRGDPRILKIVPLAFHSNYVPVLHCFWVIARYWSNMADLNLPDLYLAPPLMVTRLEFCQDFWHQKTTVLGYHMGHCLCDPRFSHFSRTLTCDGRTDRHMMTASTSLA